MHKLDQKGDLLIPLVLAVFLFFCALGFGIWAFAGRQDYKNNVQSKVDEAVEAAKEKLSIEKEADFEERYKEPFSIYKGPSAFGTLTITYPKTWSAYVDEAGSSSLPLSGYLHPKYVPASDTTNYAFRFEVTARSYADEMSTFASSVKSGKLSSAAYRLPEVESALGSRLVGEVDAKKQGTLIVLPLRDKTLKIWTEGSDFEADFAKILETLTFVP